jgi:hypothetical protein
MIGKGTYASLNRVLEEMERDFKFLSIDVDWNDIIEWIGKFVGIIGAPSLYIDKVTGEHPLTPHITVDDYKGELPSDFVSILPGGVRDATTHEVYIVGKDSFVRSGEKYAKTSGETDETLRVESPKNFVDHKTYSIREGMIFSSQDECTLELAYTAFKTDDNGFPMIPDNERIIEGCKWFIAEKLAFNMWAMGRLTDKVWNEIQQKREWYMGAASQASVIMSPEDMEAFTRAWVRLNPVLHQHMYSFRYTGLREDLNIGT